MTGSPAHMRAVQITELSGPATALQIGDVPEPPREHPMTPGSGVIVDVRSAGVSFPELLQSRGEYQMKPDLPFVPGAEVGGIVREVHGEAHVKEGDRVAAFCMLGAWAERAVAPTYFTFKIPDGLGLRPGRRAHPQLPHRLLRAHRPGPAGRGGDGGRPRRGRRRGHGHAPGRQGMGRPHHRRGLVRRQGRGGPPGRRRRGGPRRRPLARRGQGHDRRRRPHGARPRRRRSLHRQPALPARGRTGRGGGLHRRVDPRGPRQPPAAQQHRGHRRRVGRLRARLARAHRAHRPRHRGDDRVRPGPPDRRGPLPAGASRRTRSSSWTGAAPPARSFSTSSRRPRSLASSGRDVRADRALPRAPSLRRR